MLNNSMPQMIELGEFRDRKPRRLGFTDDKGQVYLPPRTAKRFTKWAKDFGLSETAIESYRKGTA